MTEMTPRKLKVTTNPNRPPWIVEWHPSLDSTMDRASELAASDPDHDHVVVADYQARGRGTRGRVWIAPPGTCLMFSFAIRRDIQIADLASLPGRIAASIADELNTRFDANVAVDLPNDLTIDGDKIAGILCQSRLRGGEIEWLVCGIGLNTNLSEAEVSVANSTSLAIKTGLAVDHEQLLQQLLSALDGYRGS